LEHARAESGTSEQSSFSTLKEHIGNLDKSVPARSLCDPLWRTGHLVKLPHHSRHADRVGKEAEHGFIVQRVSHVEDTMLLALDVDAEVLAHQTTRHGQFVEVAYPT